MFNRDFSPRVYHAYKADPKARPRRFIEPEKEKINYRIIEDTSYQVENLYGDVFKIGNRVLFIEDENGIRSENKTGIFQILKFHENTSTNDITCEIWNESTQVGYNVPKNDIRLLN